MKVCEIVGSQALGCSPGPGERPDAEDSTKRASRLFLSPAIGWECLLVPLET